MHSRGARVDQKWTQEPTVLRPPCHPQEDGPSENRATPALALNAVTGDNNSFPGQPSVLSSQDSGGHGGPAGGSGLSREGRRRYVGWLYRLCAPSAWLSVSPEQRTYVGKVSNVSNVRKLSRVHSAPRVTSLTRGGVRIRTQLRRRPGVSAGSRGLKQQGPEHRGCTVRKRG